MGMNRYILNITKAYTLLCFSLKIQLCLFASWSLKIAFPCPSTSEWINTQFLALSIHVTALITILIALRASFAVTIGCSFLTSTDIGFIIAVNHYSMAIHSIIDIITKVNWIGIGNTACKCIPVTCQSHSLQNLMNHVLSPSFLSPLLRKLLLVETDHSEPSDTKVLTE